MSGTIEPVSLLPEMARMATEMVHDVLNAFVERDAAAAVRVCERDHAVDDFYNSIFRTLLTFMMENPNNISQCTHLLFIAKNIERVGDHATNIAEMVYYAATGEHLPDRPRGEDPLTIMSTMLPKRLLLVEDDRALAELVSFHFDRAGYAVTRTGDGEEALILAEEMKPDLVLLDWMIEGISGIEVCRRLRRRQGTANVPIIMLTARGEEDDRIRGLETGADDYMTKPFSPKELVARAGAVLRRVRPALAAEALSYAGLDMDLVAHRVKRDGQSIQLGPTEYRLLRHFLENPGRVFSRQQLLETVWPHSEDIELRTVDVHIRRLRLALGEPDLVRTVRSAGYALDAEGLA